MKFLKTISVLLFSAIFLMAGSGITMFKHYCSKSNTSSTSFTKSNLNCCESKITQSDQHCEIIAGILDRKKGCCETEFKFLKIQNPVIQPIPNEYAPDKEITTVYLEPLPGFMPIASAAGINSIPIDPGPIRTSNRAADLQTFLL